MQDTKEFKPFIPAEKIVPELTMTSIILGILLSIVFGAANAYLGLRVGLTVSASIPAAVISMGVIRVILKRDSILENNMVQTIGSAGESLAAGVIFTMPALFMWAQAGVTETPSMVMVALVSLIGGCLGVLFMIPLRNALIVKEHGVLPYPEGTACAEVLLAGEEAGEGNANKAGIVFKGLGLAAVYKFVADGLKIFPSEIHHSFKNGAAIGLDVLPALMGVGYICGPRVSSYLFSGGVTAWFVLIPLIQLFGGNTIMFPATEPISTLGSWGIWTKYIRYIGAGAVAAGGILSLVKSLPLILKTFKEAMGEYGTKVGAKSRTNDDLPITIVVGGSILLVLALWAIPIIPVNLFSAFLILIFGFFFATVASRMVGVIGSSNNPVSGMAIATLLISTAALKAIGTVGGTGMTAAIVIGTVICIIAAISGDTSQDLKTGFIVGATPKKQQIGEFIGVVAAAAAIGGILTLLNTAWGYGSPELPAPQATLMKMVVEGVMGGNLPWSLVFAGVALAFVMEILGIPVLPFAVGVYLPIHLTGAIMAGGLISLFMTRRKNLSEADNKKAMEQGILYSSGLIAGEGIVGILLAIFAIVPFGNVTLGAAIDMSKSVNLGQLGGLIAFILLGITLVMSVLKYAPKENS